MSPEEKGQPPSYSTPGEIALALIQGEIKPAQARTLLAALKKNPVTVIKSEPTAADIGTSEPLTPPPTDKAIKGTKNPK